MPAVLQGRVDVGKGAAHRIPPSPASLAAVKQSETVR
jgi:hypothetical protein